MLVRSGDDRDLHAVAEMSAARSTGARLALDRSEEFIRYGITKKRLLSGLGPLGLRETEFLVVEEGYQAVAYLICTSHDGRWTIDEAGDRDPSGARLGAMLQVMLARHPSEELPEIRAWWPHGARPAAARVTTTTPSGWRPDDSPTPRSHAAAAAARSGGGRLLACGLFLGRHVRHRLA